MENQKNIKLTSTTNKNINKNGKKNVNYGTLDSTTDITTLSNDYFHTNFGNIFSLDINGLGGRTYQNNPHKKTVPDLETEEGKRQNRPLGIESLASLVNLPSSFDSINDEDNFIDIGNHEGLNEGEKVFPLFGQVIERRQDVDQISLEDIVDSEKEQNVDMVSEDLDDKILNAIEDILEIRVPNNSKIRRKNSKNKNLNLDLSGFFKK